MSRRMVMISTSCAMLVLVGVVKLVLVDWRVGLLMIGFATLLWTTFACRSGCDYSPPRPDDRPRQPKLTVG